MRFTKMAAPMSNRLASIFQKNYRYCGLKQLQNLVVLRQLSKETVIKPKSTVFGRNAIAVAAFSVFALYGFKKWKSTFKLHTLNAASVNNNAGVLLSSESTGTGSGGKLSDSVLTPWHRQNPVTKEVCFLLYAVVKS